MNLLLFGLYTLLIYFVYTRVIRMFLSKWYYERQGVVFIKGTLPVIGDLLRLKSSIDRGINDPPVA